MTHLKPEDLKPIAFELIKGGHDPEREVFIHQVNLELRYQKDGSEKWVIIRLGCRLKKSGEFEFATVSCLKSKAFLRSTQFNSIKDALKVWNKVRDKYE